MYLLTRARRPDPVNPAEGLRRIRDLAATLNYPVTSRISAFQKDRSVVIDTASVAAVRYDRGRFYVWAGGGVFELKRPARDVWPWLGLSSFRRVYRNSLLNQESRRFGTDLKRARWWLRRCALIDFLLNRPVMPQM